MPSKSVQGSSEIRQLVDQLEQQQLALKREINLTAENLQTNTIKYKDLKEEIRAKGEKCKADLDVIIGEYVNLCEKLERESEDILTGHTSDLEERYGKSVELVLDCNQALKASKAVQLSSHQLDVLSTMPELPSVQFVPGLNYTDHLKQALGKLISSRDKNISLHQSNETKQKLGLSAGRSMITTEDRKPSPEKLLDAPRNLAEFKCPGRVSSICPSLGGQAWIRHAQTLTLLDKRGQVKNKVECSDCVTDISLCPSTHKLWLCTWGKKVMTCDQNSLTEIFNTDSVPWCLCVTNTKQVVVGMKHKITLFTEKGQTVCTTSTKESGIVRPERISQCPITGNIALVDTDNKSNSLILDSSLAVLYNHIGEGAMASSIRPADLVYDGFGNLILADTDNKSLELLGGTGDYIHTIQVMPGPVKAVGADTENVLWVAVYDKQRDRYQIQVLQYYIRE